MDSATPSARANASVSVSVSVVIPTHNRAHLLGRALQSIVEQSRPADEVIVVDDGSTDETESLVRDEFPGVRFLKKENGGVSSARNVGIAASHSEWIAFLDSDDEWLPKKLARQLEEIDESPEYRLCHTDEIWIRRGRRVNPMRKHAKAGGWIFERCLPLCAVSPSSVIIRRDVFEELGTFDETLPVCEDYDLWLRICANEPVLFVDEALIAKYGGHDDQLSHSRWGMDRFRIRALEKILSGDSLDETKRAAARRTLIEKIDIYLEGARKRGKDDVRIYEEMRARWSDER